MSELSWRISYSARDTTAHSQTPATSPTAPRGVLLRSYHTAVPFPRALVNYSRGTARLGADVLFFRPPHCPSALQKAGVAANGLTLMR
jgi:hypothetical protein